VSALRTLAAAVLCALTGLLAAGGVLGVWARGQVLDTDRYLDSVGPLAASSAVQDGVARTVARAISDQIDVERIVTALGEGTATLPPGTVLPDGTQLPDATPLPRADAEAIASDVQAALQSAIEDVARDYTGSQDFRELWVAVNRAGHTQFVRLLEGDPRPVPGVVVAGAGQLRLDLTAVVEALRARVADAGMTIVRGLPRVSLVVDLAAVPFVEQVRPVVPWLDRLAATAPYAVGACALLALVAARRRLPMLGWLAVSVGLGMLALWSGLLYVRSAAIGELEAAGVGADVARVVVGQLTSVLREGVRVVAGGAVAVAAFAVAATGVRALSRGRDTSDQPA
jgi:hypothetical protein